MLIIRVKCLDHVKQGKNTVRMMIIISNESTPNAHLIIRPKPIHTHMPAGPKGPIW